MPMKIEEMVARLSHHSVPEWYYAINGLGGGDVPGIAKERNGTWVTYYSERENREDLTSWSSEEEAAERLFREVEALARARGTWTE